MLLSPRCVGFLECLPTFGGRHHRSPRPPAALCTGWPVGQLLAPQLCSPLPGVFLNSGISFRCGEVSVKQSTGTGSPLDTVQRLSEHSGMTGGRPQAVNLLRKPNPSFQVLDYLSFVGVLGGQGPQEQDCTHSCMPTWKAAVVNPRHLCIHSLGKHLVRGTMSRMLP